MSIRFILDMSVSSRWITVLAKHGWSAVHWSSIGDWGASDTQIMDWAQTNGYVVCTRDLDFGKILALTHATGPSLLQLRGKDVSPQRIGPQVIEALRQYATALATGAIV